jgi:hypothetical protein
MRLERAEALASLNAALKEAYGQIQRLFSNRDIHEVETAHEIGGIIRCIMDAGGTYGERAVERLADALGRDDGTLYRYAALARAWSARQMHKLCRRLNRCGEPLTLTHFLFLSRREDWNDLFERALTGAWTTQMLEEASKPTLASPSSASSLDADADEGTRTALQLVTRKTHRSRTGMADIGAVLERIERSPELRTTHPLLRSLDEALADLVADAKEMRTRIGGLLPQTAAAEVEEPDEESGRGLLLAGTRPAASKAQTLGAGVAKTSTTSRPPESGTSVPAGRREKARAAG